MIKAPDHTDTAAHSLRSFAAVPVWPGALKIVAAARAKNSGLLVHLIIAKLLDYSHLHIESCFGLYKAIIFALL